MMGFMSKLFGNSKTSLSGRNDVQKGLRTNDVYDICYAFSCIATQRWIYSPSYIKITVNCESVTVEVWVSKEDCEKDGITGLNTEYEIRKAVGPLPDIVRFIMSLQCAYEDELYFQLRKKLEVSNFILNEASLNSSIEKANARCGGTSDIKVYFWDNNRGAMIQFGEV